jgi:predicted DNA-binding protein (MmcQ/YjbR family)
MTLSRLRELCMSMPGATEQIQWGKDLVFKVGGKMFCVANTDPAGSEMAMSFKCNPETFAELCEREGIKPAPYMARAQWVGLERFDTLPDRELKPLVIGAYDLITARLPKKTQASLSAKVATGTKVTKVRKVTKRTKGKAAKPTQPAKAKRK